LCDLANVFGSQHPKGQFWAILSWTPAATV
jgi:hypothetical protein